MLHKLDHTKYEPADPQLADVHKTLYKLRDRFMHTPIEAWIQLFLDGPERLGHAGQGSTLQ
jgi:hypothetical protein